jgi:RNA polymerase sigma factor (sigma-70 family)
VAAVLTIDAPLLEKARAGDRSALEQLMKSHKPALERYARRHCASDDVEEAVQDALWILYRRLGGLRSVAAFAGWIYQVVRRACLKLTMSRRQDLSLDHLPAGHDHDRGVGDAELRMTLSQIIAALPLPYREVLVLKDVQGHAAEEISAVLGIRVEAVKSRLHRARAMVREALSDVRDVGQQAVNP